MPQTETEWKEKLTPEQYQVLRQGGTESPFTGEYWDSKARGVYRCAGCGEKLFSSDTKYESHSGSPHCGESLEEGAADSTPLHGVEHGDRHLGTTTVLLHDVSPDSGDDLFDG